MQIKAGPCILDCNLAIFNVLKSTKTNYAQLRQTLRALEFKPYALFGLVSNKYAIIIREI